MTSPIQSGINHTGKSDIRNKIILEIIITESPPYLVISYIKLVRTKQVLDDHFVKKVRNRIKEYKMNDNINILEMKLMNEEL